MEQHEWEGIGEGNSVKYDYNAVYACVKMS